MSQQDEVGPDELLYRCIRAKHIVPIEGGFACSESAFMDPNKEPSVDRASLCNDDPTHTRREPSDAVASLITHEVRDIKTVVKRTGSTGQTIAFTYKIDVKPDPIKDDPILPDNPAHAKIYEDQELTNNPFRRLREELAELAIIILPPG